MQAYADWTMIGRPGRRRLIEGLGVFRRLDDALLEHVAVGPAIVARDTPRSLVQLHARRRLAVLHQHVAQVEEEALDVEGGDPRVEADPLPADEGFPGEDGVEVGTAAIDDGARADVDVPPLLLEPELEAR